METMLVTQALNELKTLDARLQREINPRDNIFVASAKTCESKVNPSTTKQEFIDRAKATMDSIDALIKRRAAIKAAIIESNANTTIEVCGEPMTVAQAIDLKSSIVYKKMVLSSLKSQLSSAVSNMNRQNDKMEQNIDALITTAFGKDSKQNIKEEDYATIANPYRKANEWSLVDPLRAEDKIKELTEYIEEFESTVDAKLQISNCITTISL